MFFFDYEKVNDSLENLLICKKEYEEYFLKINDSIDRIERLQTNAYEDISVDFKIQKKEIEEFLISLQQLIGVVEYAQNYYSKTRKKLILEGEKLFLNSDVSEKMHLISLESYRREMKDIHFGKRYENE